MNNVTLGTEDWTYYETLGGGQGACPDADGPSGVHVAMSNTLNTPVEALELEFPLRVTEYAVRRGSGGDGRHRGGDGVIREVEALEDMTYSLLTERRRHPPPGADGGEDGALRAEPRRGRTRSSRRPRGRSAPASGCGSRRPAAAGTVRRSGRRAVSVAGLRSSARRRKGSRGRGRSIRPMCGPGVAAHHGRWLIRDVQGALR